MKQALFLRVTAFLAVLFLVSTAFAQNPHYVVGPNFTVNPDGSVTASGSIAGLGNQNIDIRLVVTGYRTVQCRNPGGNIAPGQTQQFTLDAEANQLRVENGRVNFSLTTNPPPAPNPAEVCPNPRWTAIPGPVTITSATLTVYQRGNVVLQDTFTP